MAVLTLACRADEAWRILPRELTVAGGESTPTLKVSVRWLWRPSTDLIEEMCAS
jgi:hypothetical protein